MHEIDFKDLDQHKSWMGSHIKHLVTDVTRPDGKRVRRDARLTQRLLSQDSIVTRDNFTTVRCVTGGGVVYLFHLPRGDARYFWEQVEHLRELSKTAREVRHNTHAEHAWWRALSNLSDEFADLPDGAFFGLCYERGLL